MALPGLQKGSPHWSPHIPLLLACVGLDDVAFVYGSYVADMYLGSTLSSGSVHERSTWEEVL